MYSVLNEDNLTKIFHRKAKKTGDVTMCSINVNISSVLINIIGHLVNKMCFPVVFISQAEGL